jgi:hypothetical protein
MPLPQSIDFLRDLDVAVGPSDYCRSSREMAEHRFRHVSRLARLPLRHTCLPDMIH